MQSTKWHSHLSITLGSGPFDTRRLLSLALSRTKPGDKSPALRKVVYIDKWLRFYDGYQFYANVMCSIRRAAWIFGHCLCDSSWRVPSAAQFNYQMLYVRIELLLLGNRGPWNGLTPVQRLAGLRHLHLPLSPSPTPFFLFGGPNVVFIYFHLKFRSHRWWNPLC